MPANGFVQPFAGIISFLSTLVGGDKGIRTPDLLHAKQALSQLSYTPMERLPKFERLSCYFNSIAHSERFVKGF